MDIRLGEDGFDVLCLTWRLLMCGRWKGRRTLPNNNGCPLHKEVLRVGVQVYWGFQAYQLFGCVSLGFQ